jgi:hypothetical protein
MIAEVSSWNSLATLLLGASFNLLAIWMIVRHTPKEMRVYSLLLLQTCLADLTLLILSYILQPVIVMAIDSFFYAKNMNYLNNKYFSIL